MSQSALYEITDAEVSDSHWKGLYRLGGTAALLAALIPLIDIALTFLPSGAEQPGTLSAVEWFALFQDSWFFGLRNLGLLPNILTLVLLIPVFLALYGVHQHRDPAYAALATILSLVGTGVYLSNNAAFPMLALSAKYAVAPTEAQRTLLAAAGEAILARGEDFTPGALAGFVLGELAILAISVVMLRGRRFSKATGYAGMLAGIFLTIFTIWSTFIPVLFEVSMVVAMIGGILSIVWYILTARRLFQLGGGLWRTQSDSAALVPVHQ